MTSTEELKHNETATANTSKFLQSEYFMFFFVFLPCLSHVFKVSSQRRVLSYILRSHVDSRQLRACLTCLLLNEVDIWKIYISVYLSVPIGQLNLLSQNTFTWKIHFLLFHILTFGSQLTILYTNLIYAVIKRFIFVGELLLETFYFYFLNF